MNPGHDDRLEVEIRELTAALEEERRAGRRASLTMLVTNLALILIVAGFLTSISTHLSSEFTEESFARSFEKEARQLSPQALDELVALGNHLLPVYAHEAQQQLVELGPRLETILAGEVGELGRDIQLAVSAQLEATGRRMGGRLDTILTETFPELQTIADRERFIDEFSRIMADSLAQLHLDVEQRYSQHVDDLRSAIARIDVPDRGEPTWELQKRFIHLWLVLIDEEVMKL